MQLGIANILWQYRIESKLDELINQKGAEFLIWWGVDPKTMREANSSSSNSSCTEGSKQFVIKMFMHKEVNEVDAKWEVLFEEFEEYKTQYDYTTEVPRSHQILCNWVRTQRDAYRANSMKEERKCRLNPIGFARNAEAQWTESYELTVELGTKR